MIKLIDDSADENEAWIHAVDVGSDFFTCWVKHRKPEYDKRFPVHNRARFHEGRMPQEWIAERWPEKRWAAHFHVPLSRKPTEADVDEFRSMMSAGLANQVDQTIKGM